MNQRIRTALKVLTNPKKWTGYPGIPNLPRYEEADPGLPATPLFAVERLNESIRRTRDRFLNIQNEKGYWVFDLEADATIPSEYILLQRFLGHEIPGDLKVRLSNYLRNRQLHNGGWPLYFEGEGNISASIKAYFALKQLGDSPDAPHMARARAFVLKQGGAAEANVFTRIMLALFGQVPWETTPAMPIEIMLLPKWFFFHLNKISYWSRTVIVPLLILYAKRPVCRLKPEEGVSELFVSPAHELHHLDHFVPGSFFKNCFLLLDRALKKADPMMPRVLRKKGLRLAETWTRERMRGEGGIGAIFPAMANAVMAFHILGYPADHPDLVIAKESVRRLLTFEDTPIGEAPNAGIPRPYCQPCLSPIWDTSLATHALLEAGECDDAVARRTDAHLYVRALATLEELRAPALAAASTDGPLLARVRRLIAPASMAGSTRITPSTVIATMALISLTAAAFGLIATATAEDNMESVDLPGVVLHGPRVPTLQDLPSLEAGRWSGANMGGSLAFSTIVDAYVAALSYGGDERSATFVAATFGHPFHFVMKAGAVWHDHN